VMGDGPRRDGSEGTAEATRDVLVAVQESVDDNTAMGGSSQAL